MKVINDIISDHELSGYIQNFPREHRKRIYDFAQSLDINLKDEERAWSKENSLMNTSPLTMSDTSWSREELYDRKCFH